HRARSSSRCSGGCGPKLLPARLPHALRHDYCSPLFRSAYSRSAQITSLLKERSYRLARARIVANTSDGNRVEIRCSSFGAFSLKLTDHLPVTWQVIAFWLTG